MDKFLDEMILSWPGPSNKKRSGRPMIPMEQGLVQFVTRDRYASNDDFRGNYRVYLLCYDWENHMEELIV